MCAFFLYACVFAIVKMSLVNFRMLYMLIPLISIIIGICIVCFSLSSKAAL